MTDEKVIAVDKDGNEKGLVDRYEAHTEGGILHSAFSCLVFDRQDRVLLAQRSRKKRLWGGYWDGTIASHPAEGQEYTDAVVQRLEEELGIGPDQYSEPDVVDAFEYESPYFTEGIEHEVCTVLTVTLQDTETEPDRKEVNGLLWAPYEQLKEFPEDYLQLNLCPWFEIALNKYPERLNR